jgi:hypothetical protein
MRLSKTISGLFKANEIREKIQNSSVKEITSHAVETGYSILIERFLPLILMISVCSFLLGGVIGFLLGNL